jgi:pullulanase
MAGGPRRRALCPLQSAGATLQVARGAAVEGADARIPLERDASPLAPDVAQRFRFIAAGVRLTLPVAAQGQVAGLLRDQHVLVREDADGRVLEATGIQLPGALDDLYARAADAPDLGATLQALGTAGGGLAVWAPTARAVAACVYPRATGDSATVVPLVRDETTGIWRARVRGHVRGVGYLYL